MSIGIKLVFSLLNYKDDARSHKHKNFIRIFYFEYIKYIF